MTITRETLLVIDDDSDFRELIRLHAECEGIDVLEATDCVEGVACLREASARIAVVLLDYWMPNMQPVPCARSILSLVRPNARVILVTAAVDAKKRALELGLSEWLSKPFDFEVVRRIVLESRSG
jgi:DNA-binding response OmpR family regulator